MSASAAAAAAAASAAASGETYYFCASAQSVHDLMRRGIWHDMSLNATYRPITPETVVHIGEDGSELNATDIRISRYVRLVIDPAAHLASYEGNLAEVFIIEVDGKIMDRKDVLKIKHIADGAFEHLKMIMVDPFSVRRVHTIAAAVERKLRAQIADEQLSIPIVTSPELFPSDVSGLSFDFEIAAPLAAPAVEPAPARASQITIRKGDLLRSRMQTLVNTVNCVGVMGKGIALAFKRQYPAMFADYAARCKRGGLSLGEPYCFNLVTGKKILNFPTKGHWRQNSKLDEIERGLQYLVTHFKDWGITSMAIPPLGCGNGGLDWAAVLPLMRRYLDQMEIPVEIYAPHEANTFGAGAGAGAAGAAAAAPRKRVAPKKAGAKASAAKQARRH